MANPTGKGGFQERKHQINRKGRPKSFDALRELARAIAHEGATIRGEPVVVNGKKATITEVILRQWAASKNHQLQRAFMEIAFGKVPDKLDVTSGGKRLGEATQAVYDRAFATLVDAVGEEVSSENGGSNSSVATTE